MDAKPRTYTDDDKAIALAALDANCGNAKRTARELGIPVRTLTHWRNRERQVDATPENDDGSAATLSPVARRLPQQRAALADNLEAIAYRAIRLLPRAMKLATAAQLAVVLGVAVDKMRLLREQSTSNKRDVLSDEERIQRLTDILMQAKEKQALAQLQAPTPEPTQSEKAGGGLAEERGGGPPPNNFLGERTPPAIPQACVVENGVIRCT